jgi:DNA polymerase-3 subunit alpha
MDLASEIMSYLSRSHRVVAHNVSYDCDMIDIELARCGKKLVWPEKFCSVEATEFLKGHRMNLTSLHEYLFGEPFAGAHRAEPDVRATAKCYMELVRRNWA